MRVKNFVSIADCGEPVLIVCRNLKKLYDGDVFSIDYDLLEYEIWALYTTAGKITLEINYNE